MGLNKKIIISLIFTLVAGAAGGYYAGQKNQSQNLEKIDLKLGLLKDYTDFVFLPPEKITDPVKYADAMGEKVKEINDSEITSKFYATGENDDREQKILDFLDFLNTSIKGDLK